jgi:serine/threonine protein kinase HipA of HipAB toxin-antitoxin module
MHGRTRLPDGLLGKNVTGQIVDAGFPLDYIDSRVIDTAGIQHRILILPGYPKTTLVAVGR